MQRIYQTLIEEHLTQNKQMLFLAGPRQVGKTTLSIVAKQYTDNFFTLIGIRKNIVNS